MITYELAKQLKDAGFKQEYAIGNPWMDFAYDDGEELHMLHEDNDTNWWIGNNYNTIAKDYSDIVLKEVQNNFVKCPTLSELIEACGKIPFSIHYQNDGRIYASFEVEDEHGNRLDFCLNSLEEIFAMLWLELNK